MLHPKKLQSQLIKLTSEDIILLIFNLKKVNFDNNSNSHYYYCTSIISSLSASSWFLAAISWSFLFCILDEVDLLGVVELGGGVEVLTEGAPQIVVHQLAPHTVSNLLHDHHHLPVTDIHLG